jgi:hypothetical protein
VVVVSDDDAVLRQCSVCFGHLPLKVDTLDLDTSTVRGGSTNRWCCGVGKIRLNAFKLDVGVCCHK